MLFIYTDVILFRQIENEEVFHAIRIKVEKQRKCIMCGK